MWLKKLKNILFFKIKNIIVDSYFLDWMVEIFSIEGSKRPTAGRIFCKGSLFLFVYFIFFILGLVRER